MSGLPEGNAVVYCEGAFDTTNGKTAHGLVRRTVRYRVLSVVDGALAGRDAGEVLDGRPCGIPVVGSLGEAMEEARSRGVPATHLVVGLAPDGGMLPPSARADVLAALEAGLNVDCGLHTYLSDDPEMVEAARAGGAVIRDVRRPRPARDLHFFTGKIEEVDCLKVALLGTDSAVGKRTTAWMLVEALRERDLRAEIVGTGQTTWMQGAPYCIILDSIINDFVAGEIEHVTWSAWKGAGAEVLVLEGQGSLLNPAYPGGFELMAAGRPDVVVLQHAPARTEYDGFPGWPMHPLDVQIRAVELVGGKPVVAVAVNHQGLPPDQVPLACQAITRETGLPAVDVLKEGAGALVDVLEPLVRR
jgi:uncharacterized NAD-dependent epimerase/dehydratase family protein